MSNDKTRGTGRARRTVLAGITTLAVIVPASITGLGANAAPPTTDPFGPSVLEPVDPQVWQDMALMTWNDYKPLPAAYDWAHKTQGSQRQFKGAIVLVDFKNQPFVVTLPNDPSKPLTHPSGLAAPVARADVPQFYKDMLNTPTAFNRGHTINEYWMEQTGGRISVDLEAFGPYELPGNIEQYGLNDSFNRESPDSHGVNSSNRDFCPITNLAPGDPLGTNACNKNISTDSRALWLADLRAKGYPGADTASNPQNLFNSVFYVTAGQDESSVWEEFGQMIFTGPDAVSDEYGPPRDATGSALNVYGDEMENWAKTRYIPWTSWAAAINQWPGASGNSSTQGESSGMATFAHEFTHILGIGDNYGNPYGVEAPDSGPLRDTSGPYDVLSRGCFNGPGGTHQRYAIPSFSGASQPAGVTLRDRLYLNTISADNYVRLPQEDIDQAGSIATTVTSRAVMREGDITGINLVLDKPAGATYADDSTGTCRRTSTQYGGAAGGVPHLWDCDGGGYDNYTVEVVDRIGTDSFQPDHGVYLNKTKNAGGAPYIWTIDANPQDLGWVDYVRPNGDIVPVTRGDQRQLNDALFHAGTGSDSEYEYEDTYNGLHFYFTNAHRDAEGMLQYDVAIRSLRNPGPQVRGVEVGTPIISGTTDNAIVQLLVPVTNTGVPVPDATANSDIYRLSAGVSGAQGWELTLPEEIAVIPAGETQEVTVWAHKTDPAAADLANVRVTIGVKSENDPSAKATKPTILPTGPRPVTLPKFDADTGVALDVYTDHSKWILEQFWLEVPGIDTDGDGWNDLIHMDVTRQGETATEGLKVPVILAASPYYAGTTNVQNHTMYTEVGEEPPYGDAPYTLGGTNTRTIKTSGSGASAFRYAIANTNIADYVPKGFAVAHAENLGAGWSEGCPTAGDINEQKAVKAAVEWFVGKGTAYTDETRTHRIDPASWSTGKIAMLGTSYVGALPIMAAVQQAEGLVAISPDSSPGSWYEYYRANGSYKAPGGYPGEDTDLHAKFNYSSMKFSHLADPTVCQPVFEQLEQSQDRASSNYSGFWEPRNYAKTIKDWKVAVLLEGGFRDWNVMFKHQSLILEQLKLHNKNWQAWFHQRGHGNSHPTAQIRNAFFTHYLYGGAPSGGEQKVWLFNSNTLEQASYNWNNVQPEEFPTWPVPGAEDVSLNLAAVSGREAGTLSLLPNTDDSTTQSFTDDASAYGNSVPTTSSATARPGLPSDQVYTVAADDTPVTGHRLIYISDPVTQDVRLSGTPKVSLNIALLNKVRANLSVILVSYPAARTGINTTPQIISRGWMDPENRNSIWTTDPVTMGTYYQLSWDMEPKDYTITAGSRLAFVVLSTDPAFTVRPAIGTQLAVRPALSSITLPLVGGADLFAANLNGSVTAVSVETPSELVVAGQPVALPVTAVGETGSYGDVSDAVTYTSSVPSDVFSGGQLTATEAGPRTVTATYGGLAATVSVTVAPAGIDQSEGLELFYGDPTLDGLPVLALNAGSVLEIAGAAGFDQYGNPIDVSDSLAVGSDVDSDVVAGTSVTFAEPGVHTLTVQAGGLTRYLLVVVAPDPDATPEPQPTVTVTASPSASASPSVSATPSETASPVPSETGTPGPGGTVGPVVRP
ncbi:MAG: CocE/NonD family hydrolase, partial [Bifidobacteriaceae bacterium]|nr:CocE/NonD family hydrolase [Bifidobacteriaceae bacterium]